jgi:acyl carrier protein
VVPEPVETEIRALIAREGYLALDVEALGDEDDLYRAGLTSHDTVNLMLALEDRFGVEFPDRLLTRRTFQSIGALAAALRELLPDGATA